MTARPTLLAALLVLAACGRDDGGRVVEPAGSEPAPGEYVATGLPSPYEAGDVLRMRVRDGEVSVQATCNTLSGSAGWSARRLEVSDLGGTEMGCPGKGFAQDEWLAAFLTSSPAYDVAGGSVTLTRGGDRITLVPADRAGTPGGSADASLTGTRWRLTGVEETDGDSVSLRTVDEPRSSLRIRDGEITFGTTCNVAGGRVTVTDDRLRLGQVVVTLQGCLDDRGSIEHDVMHVMRRWVDWSVTGEQLRLTRGDLGLVYRAR